MRNLIQNTGAADQQLMSYTVTGIPVSAYTAIGDPISIREFTQIISIMEVVLGNLSNISYYLQFSLDVNTWYDDSVTFYTGGAVDIVRRSSMMNVDGSERLMIPNYGFNYIRCMVLGTTDNTDSELTWGIARGWGNENGVMI